MGDPGRLSDGIKNVFFFILKIPELFPEFGYQGKERDPPLCVHIGTDNVVHERADNFLSFRRTILC